MKPDAAEPFARAARDLFTQRDQASARATTIVARLHDLGQLPMTFANAMADVEARHEFRRAVEAVEDITDDIAALNDAAVMRDGFAFGAAL